MQEAFYIFQCYKDKMREKEKLKPRVYDTLLNYKRETPVTLLEEAKWTTFGLYSKMNYIWILFLELVLFYFTFSFILQEVSNFENVKPKIK